MLKLLHIFLYKIEASMIKKLKNTDILFIISLLSILLLHIFFVFVIPFSDDESYYVTVPLRLMNGDSLVQNEWHLTQFSTLFSYLPVYIWMTIKGSADGIFIFLRCTYLLIHTTVAVLIYRFFRQYGKWAIMASMIFYIQIAYRIQAISYQSMFVVFLLLLVLCLLSIYNKKSAVSYIFLGICFGCCCVCNPLFCFAFVIYLLGCALWTKRLKIVEFIIKHKASPTEKGGKKLTKKQKKEQKQQILASFPEMENYNCFFSKEAILRISCGIIIVAIVAVSFFFLTGGTIDSIFDNIENLLGSSEYDIASNSLLLKIAHTISFFSMANLGLPFILPILFIALFIDKNNKLNKHRFVYLSISVLWAILFIFGVFKNLEIYLCAISLPFYVTSTICYILTENKNKKLFYCMHVPCLIATVFQYLAADTQLGAIGVVLAVSNVAGVFFAMDLWKEMRSASINNSETSDKKTNVSLRNIIIIAFCLQILFYGLFYQHGQAYGKDSPKATKGPFSGLHMTEEEHNVYNKVINDMDIIKDISDEDDPVLLVSYKNWMYLYLNRPIATYTAWYRGSIDTNLLAEYYKENPDKIPKYIYLESSDPKNTKVQIVSEMFEFTRQDLSNGVLLIVEHSKI